MTKSIINDRPLVTFVVFAFNQENYIREAIQGALSQTYRPLEILLSDDCSTDKTYEIMKEVASEHTGQFNLRIRQNKSNQGLAQHINSFVEEAKGDYVAWSAGDDISLPHRVEMLMKPCLDDPEVVGTYSDLEEIDLNSERLHKVRRRNFPKKPPSVEEVVTRRYSINTQTHLFSKKVFEKFGNLNSDLTHEASCMTLREILIGKTVYVPSTTLLYRIGSGVSSYKGNDLEKLTRYEPAKYAAWRMSSCKQMLCDLNKHSDKMYAQEKMYLYDQYISHKRLMKINKNHFDIISLSLNLLNSNIRRKSIRAFIRRNSPNWLYHLTKQNKN